MGPLEITQAVNPWAQLGFEIARAVLPLLATALVAALVAHIRASNAQRQEGFLGALTTAATTAVAYAEQTLGQGDNVEKFKRAAAFVRSIPAFKNIPDELLIGVLQGAVNGLPATHDFLSEKPNQPEPNQIAWAALNELADPTPS